ncbi:hypothetical protein MMC26_005088 [Xylographa opegraphella]|nr:hypothetical protein [Xylographa opegraphella]
MAEQVLKIHLDRILSSRQHPKTICPSEAPRALSAPELRRLGASDWRDLMPEVRRILWAMRDEGEVEILQKGVALADDLASEDVVGPIRARKVESGKSTA